MCIKELAWVLHLILKALYEWTSTSLTSSVGGASKIFEFLELSLILCYTFEHSFF